VSKIDKYNYEAFFLDYWENRLNASQKAELELFLDRNSELKAEFEAFEDFSFTPENNIQLPDKDKLKSGVIQDAGDINASNYEEYLIGSLENDLSSDQKQQLEIFLHHNPVLKQELAAYHDTRLTPDQDITYEHKEELYRRKVQIISLPNLYRVVAAAASILILFGLYQFFLNPEAIPDKTGQERIASYTMMTNNIGQIEIPDHPTILPAPQSVILPQYHSYNIRVGNITKISSIESPSALLPKNHFNDYASLLNPVLPPGIIIFEYKINQQKALLAGNHSKENKTLVGKIISGIFKNVSDRVQPEREPIDEIKPARASFWDLAESGLTGYNYLTNNDVILVRTLDKNGKTKNVRFLRDDEVLNLSSDH